MITITLQNIWLNYLFISHRAPNKQKSVPDKKNHFHVNLLLRKCKFSRFYEIKYARITERPNYPHLTSCQLPSLLHCLVFNFPMVLNFFGSKNSRIFQQQIQFFFDKLVSELLKPEIFWKLEPVIFLKKKCHNISAPNNRRVIFFFKFIKKILNVECFTWLFNIMYINGIISIFLYGKRYFTF